MKIIRNKKKYDRKIKAWRKFEPKLKIADIILTHNSPPNSRLWVSKKIREVTNSDWVHVALVFAIPNKKNQFNNVLIVEARDRGIEIHRIREYTKYIDFTHIGVKRVPSLSEKERQKVLAYMLNNVDTPYDFMRIFAIYIEKIFSKNIFKDKKSKLFNKDNFICSSFVQKSYFKAAQKKHKQEVIFKDVFNNLLDLEDIYPSDIAKSKKCEWLFDSRKY